MCPDLNTAVNAFKESQFSHFLNYYADKFNRLNDTDEHSLVRYSVVADSHEHAIVIGLQGGNAIQELHDNIVKTMEPVLEKMIEIQ